jgi:hypothetical protein
MRNQKEHQTNMDQCLSHLENRTISINDNIAAMMEHWQITPSQKRRAVSVMHSHDNNNSSAQPLERDGVTPQDTDSKIMDIGVMEE